MTRPRTLIALAVLSAACGDTIGPVAGPYVMTSLDQVELPHLVSASVACDVLVLRGSLDLRSTASFLLQVTQAQDCTRAGAASDTFTTTVAGSFTLAGGRLTLHPAGTGLTYDGAVSAGAVDLQLPPLPLVAPPQHAARFVKFPL